MKLGHSVEQLVGEKINDYVQIHHLGQKVRALLWCGRRGGCRPLLSAVCLCCVARLGQRVFRTTVVVSQDQLTRVASSADGTNELLLSSNHHSYADVVHIICA
jgi:hypothetical protein